MQMHRDASPRNVSPYKARFGNKSPVPVQSPRFSRSPFDQASDDSTSTYHTFSELLNSSQFQPLVSNTGDGTSANKSADSVKVAVRVRSFLSREKKNNENLSIRMKQNTCELTFNEKTRYVFSFDHCFWSNDIVDGEMPYSSQEDVYNSMGKPLIEHVLKGMNASIIAYGQTGSGKTYSLYGPANATPESYGLIPRVCNEIFSCLRAQNVSFKASVSMVEVYLERVYDLLNHRQELNIRGDLRNGFHVLRAKKTEVSEYEAILNLLKDAESLKTYASTAQNERSSRAHTLFELNLRMITETGTRTSRLMLVDLAGSERIKLSQAQGKVFEQACNINLSLMNLGKCIEAVVSSRSSHNQVVEFRHSSLTKLLKESLGGNARTMILATVSPSEVDSQNTLHALRFADRAKKIRNHAVINEYSLERQQIMSDEIKKVYEDRMNMLKLEYDIESKQQALLAREIELEAQNVTLNNEKVALAQQRKEYQMLTKNEKEALSQREREVQDMSERISTELSQMKTQRDDIESRMAAIQATNTQILAEKQIAQDEVDTLQAEVFESNYTHRIFVEQTERLDMTHAEENARYAIAEEYLKLLVEVSQLKSIEAARASDLHFKSELIAGRRKSKADTTCLERQLQESSEKIESLEKQRMQKDNEHKFEVAQLSKHMEALNLKLEVSATELSHSIRNQEAQELQLQSTIQSLDAAESALHEKLTNQYIQSKCIETVQSETINRQHISLSSLHELVKIQTERVLEQSLLSTEVYVRNSIESLEQNELREIRETFFIHQKHIFYRKALSLTKCIRSDRVL